MGWFSRKKAKKFVKKYGKKVFRKTPYGRAYTAGEWTYKAGRYGYNRLKSRQKKAYGQSRKKSRRGSSSSSPTNQYRRGRKYYYYRGKRIYRK